MTRHNFRAHPSCKSSDQVILILVRQLLQEALELFRRRIRKDRPTSVPFESATSAEAIHAQRLPVESPDLGDAQGGVNVHSIQRTACDVDFDGKVGRRVALNVKSRL